MILQYYVVDISTNCASFPLYIIFQCKFDCELERIQSAVSCHISRVEYFALLPFRPRISVGWLDAESDLTVLQACTTSVIYWLTRGVWSKVAVSAILIAFQVCHNNAVTFALKLKNYCRTAELVQLA